MKSVSLVIALYNQVDYTRRCIDSIVRCTRIPYELILVDNGSVDGTTELLKTVQATVITNEKNLGCAKAWNQGIRASHGEVVGILNNDIVVTPGWVEHLIAFMESRSYGIVCPSARGGTAELRSRCLRRHLHTGMSRSGSTRSVCALYGDRPVRVRSYRALR